MDFTGTIFERQEKNLATFTADVVGDYIVVQITVNDIIVIKFPLHKDSDSNEIALRVGNIVNQTMLVDNPVRVEVAPTA